MKKIFATIILLGIISLVGASFSQVAESEGYILLENLPVGGYNVDFAEIPVTLSDYLEWLYVFAISITGIAAVVTIAIGGVQYIISYGNPGKMTSAKDNITNALLGLLLAVSAWLILYTINPDLVKNGLTIPDIERPIPSVPPTPLPSGDFKNYTYSVVQAELCIKTGGTIIAMTAECANAIETNPGLYGGGKTCCQTSKPK